MSIEKDLSNEFVRIRTRVGDRTTSVSMDATLARILAERLGGWEKLTAWVKRHANDMEERLAVATEQSGTRPRIGLSRLVQRVAIEQIAGGNVN